ncbi:hypothetical protein [Mycobacterium sp.]|uniref:hypothetical protein n=1 Tax=Mycobacterium sp. TaxID=1785 RepID=UPI003BAE479D
MHYGRLGAEGPMVAVLELQCFDPGDLASSAIPVLGSVAIFDAVDGKVSLHGLVVPQLPSAGPAAL